MTSIATGQARNRARTLSQARASLPRLAPRLALWELEKVRVRVQVSPAWATPFAELGTHRGAKVEKQRPVRVVLASSSPGRRWILEGAGIEPEVAPPHVDEAEVRSVVTDDIPEHLVATLAEAKARVVEAQLLASANLCSGADQPPVVIVGCDSLLGLDGRLWGKPKTPQQAVADFEAFSGRSALVRTGHHVIVHSFERGVSSRRAATAVSETTIQFAELTRREIKAYVATGEPMRIAGCTIGGVGGAFITTVVGDPHAVGGLSLPLLRRMVIDLGIEWERLWNRSSWIVGGDQPAP